MGKLDGLTNLDLFVLCIAGVGFPAALMLAAAGEDMGPPVSRRTLLGLALALVATAAFLTATRLVALLGGF